jgi:hypothetical protein
MSDNSASPYQPKGKGAKTGRSIRRGAAVFVIRTPESVPVKSRRYGQVMASGTSDKDFHLRMQSEVEELRAMAEELNRRLNVVSLFLTYMDSSTYPNSPPPTSETP